MPSTQSLEGWEENRRDSLVRAAISEGWAGHLPAIGVLLPGCVPSFRHPRPTRTGQGDCPPR